MNWENINMILKMSRDKNVIRAMVDIYRTLKEDRKFSLYKYIKMMLNIVRGEKIVKHQGRYVISTFLPPFPSRAFETNIMAVKRNRDVFTQQAYAFRSAPISMYMSLTSKCPNNCVYCSEKNKPRGHELSTDEWKTVIKGLQDMNTSVIGFTGGEPMTREDIYDIVASVDDRSVSILFTSGFNLTLERAEKLKKSGLFGIGISLDSHERTVHNKNRNSEKAFDFAIEAIRNASSAGLYTMVQTVVLRESVERESLLKLFELAGECGAQEVKLLEPMPSGKLIGAKEAKRIFYDNSTRRKLVEIQHWANKRAGLPKITSFAYTESEEKFGCGAGTQHSYISSSGDVYPCDFVPLSFGNVRDREIGELWARMNDECKIPRINCLARALNSKIYEASKGELPVSRDGSISLIRTSQSKIFPKYYRDMQ